MENLITEVNLIAGMEYLLLFKPSWTPDFHYEFYQALRLLRQNGLDEDWWRKMVDILFRWRAIRPNTKEQIFQSGVGELGKLDSERSNILKISNDSPPSLEYLEWHNIEKLYLIASGIKPTKSQSPVFGSKLCHFILPDAFPVIDGEAVGLRDYQSYWTSCKSQWAEASDREALKLILQKRIPGFDDLDYPFSTKITELCLIGERHRNSGNLMQQSKMT